MSKHCSGRRRTHIVAILGMMLCIEFTWRTDEAGHVAVLEAISSLVDRVRIRHGLIRISMSEECPPQSPQINGYLQIGGSYHAVAGCRLANRE